MQRPRGREGEIGLPSVVQSCQKRISRDVREQIPQRGWTRNRVSEQSLRNSQRAPKLDLQRDRLFKIPRVRLDRLRRHIEEHMNAARLGPETNGEPTGVAR